jgi:MFS family permease
MSALARLRPSPIGGRDFTLVWLGEAVSQLGSSMSGVALPLLVLSLGGSPAQAGFVAFAKALPRFATALLSGMVVDRFDRRRVLICGYAGRGLAVAAVLAGLAAGHVPVALLAVVGFIDGCLYTASYAAERAVVRDLVAAEDLPDAVARMEARLYAVLIVGPAVGGLLFGIQRSLPFVVDVVSYLGAGLAVAAVRTPLNAHLAGGGTAARGRIHDGVTFIWRSPFLRAGALLIAGVMPLYTALFLFAVLLAHSQGDSALQIGLMYGLIGIGGLLGGLFVIPLRRLVGRRALLVQQSVLAATTALLAIAPGALTIGLLIALGELLSPVVVSALQGYRMAVTPPQLQGRVQASSMLITQALAWVGPLAAGVAFQLLGPTATALGLGAWAALLAVAILATPTLRRVPQAPRL